MSAFCEDFAAAAAMFAEAFGVSVDYIVAGVVAKAAVTAEVVLQTHKTQDSYGAVQTIVSRDYLVLASDIGVIPEPGHRVRETICGVEKTFEVMRIGDGPCWQPVSADHRRIVIHTKEVS